MDRRVDAGRCIDTAIWWEDDKGSRLTLAEWKYTEPDFGPCSTYEDAYPKCDTLSMATLAEGCRLARPPRGRNYWRLLQDAGMDETKLVGLPGCPFRGPFYQLARQFLVAAFIRDRQALRVDVISIGFKGNVALLSVPPELSSLEQDILHSWNSTLLPCVPPLKHYYAQQIVDAVRKDATTLEQQRWLKYLSERYGL